MLLLRLRFRSVLAVIALVIIGMMLLHPDANADPVTPVPTTTVASAQADPIWAELGYTQIGQEVTGRWLDRDYWDATHDYTTPGVIKPSIAGRSLYYTGYAHYLDDGTTLISSFSMDQTSHKITGWVAANQATWCGQDTCPQSADHPLPGSGHGSVSVSIDPFMWIAGKEGEGAQSILGWVMGDAAHTLKPDLTLSWFVDAWQRSFGIGSIILIFLLAVRVGVGVKKGENGDEWVADIGLALGGFFVAGSLGPIFGQVVINGAGALGDNIAGGGALAAMQVLVDTIGRIIGGDGTAVGGSIIAMIILGVILFATVAALVVMVSGAAITYLSAALFLIGYAWVILQRYRAGSVRALRVFAVVVASKPAMFLIFSIGMNLMTTTVTGTGSIPGDVANLFIGAVIMLSGGTAAFLVWHYLGVRDASQHQMPGGQHMGMMIAKGAATRGTSVLRGGR